MKKILVIGLVLVMVSVVWSGILNTVTSDWLRGERGFSSNSGMGEIKTLTIRQVRTNPDDANDANALSGEQAFTDSANRFLKRGINGWLLTVSLKGDVGGDSNGVTLALKGMTTGLTYFSGTIIDFNKPYPIDVNGLVYSVPVNEVIDGNWSGNDYNDFTIYLNIKSKGD